MYKGGGNTNIKNKNILKKIKHINKKVMKYNIKSGDGFDSQSLLCEYLL